VSSSNNLTQKRAKDCSFFVLSPYLLTSGMLGVGIYFCARLRGKPHITFYGEVQDQPLRVKFTLYGLIATFDRTHHRHQWSDAAMVSLHTYVKNHVWNCYVLEGCGWGTDNVVFLYDHKDQSSLASRIIDKQLAIATVHFFEKEDDISSHCWGNTQQTHLNILPAGFHFGSTNSANPRYLSMFRCSFNFFTFA
jgi:hypothetical protein